MKIIDTVIPEVKIFEPNVFGDERGFFFESFNQKAFAKATGLSPTFVQDNHSKSARGVLRGLHYQIPPKAQGKLTRVIQGKIFDVAVDIRKSSPTFGRWVGEILTDENKKQIWIPGGFAHGFLTLSKTAEVLYKTTDYYAPKLERCIRWDDPDIGIEWPIDAKPQISDKDARAPGLKDAEVYL